MCLVGDGGPTAAPHLPDKCPQGVGGAARSPSQASELPFDLPLAISPLCDSVCSPIKRKGECVAWKVLRDSLLERCLARSPSVRPHATANREPSSLLEMSKPLLLTPLRTLHALPRSRTPPSTTTTTTTTTPVLSGPLSSLPGAGHPPPLDTPQLPPGRRAHEEPCEAWPSARTGARDRSPAPACVLQGPRAG